MSKRKGKLQIQRNARRIELPGGEEHQTLFFYKVWIADDEIVRVEQLPDWPFDASEDNGSLLSFTGAGFAIQVTWLPFKPEPHSELRYKGYLSILDDLGSRSPKLKRLIETSDFGIGHPDPDKVQIEWHKPQGDDA